MGQQHRQFSPAFKADAVALVRATGRPVAAIARELGVGESNLSYWRKKDGRAALRRIRAGSQRSPRRPGRTPHCGAGSRSWRPGARS
jgi:transposase-like protein